jgi:hypothetical protein
MNINSPDADIRMVCIDKHQMLFACYLKLPRFFDDSNVWGIVRANRFSGLVCSTSNEKK